MADMYGNHDSVDGEKPPWLHGKLKRPQVSEMIPKVEGAFLVRDSTKRPGDFVLSVFNGGKVQHFVIEANNGEYRITDGPKYRSLSELVDFYKHHPDSPTRLTDAVWRPDVVRKPTGKKDKLPPPIPISDVEDPYSDTPVTFNNVTDGPVLPRKPGSERPDIAPAVSAPTKEMTDEEREAELVRKREQQRIAREAIDALRLEEQEVEAPEGADVAYERERQFEREAMMTEKLNIFWLNNMLKEMGQEKLQVQDVKDSIKSGVHIMKVLAHLSKQKPPRYSANPRMAVQIKDNWVAIVSFMRDLGIQVDGDKITGEGDDVQIDVSLNADLLGDTDRRELLKLFTKIMLYEHRVKK